MSPELVVVAIIVGILVVSLIGKLLPKRQPKETHFKCARCGAHSKHTDRTIEAWRNNKAKFYCPACHSKWLQSLPPRERENFSHLGNASSRSGCLGVVVVFAVLPVATYFLVHAYA